MTTFRHRLHFWVAAWLIFQVATLSALVPQDCCAAHKAQHQKAPDNTTAPGNAAHDGHHAAMNHGTEQPAPKVPLEQCVMRGTCKGPMSAVVALLSNQGVPPLDAFSIAPDLGVTVIAGATSEHITSRLASPDPPPPRA